MMTEEQKTKTPTSIAATVRRNLAGLKVGESFVLDCGASWVVAYRVARTLGQVITAEKLNGGGVRIWRRL